MTIPGKLGAQINKAESVLRDLGLFEERNPWVTYPPLLPRAVRALSYVDEFHYYTRNRLFDIRLVDQAIFQFKIEDGGKVSYCYFQTPYDVPTYKEFVAEQLGGSVDDVEDLGDLLQEDYEQVIGTARLRNGVTPIRYDYHSELYEVGVHPAAHLHIGTGNEIRLFTTRLMLPLSFVLFVLRQMYPDAWRSFLLRRDAPVICRIIREDLDRVAREFFGELDRFQLVLD